ncbi:MAG: zinc ribbon domain-containing protein [Ramlibacter sp.]|nr:zinc ribbon domain-containing protein [Ramlibacter sp.]
MPIYAYKCASCGHAKDVLQKLSDEPLTVCPACGAASFSKQVTAAGFQLKGSGWYATDFRNGSKPAPAGGDKADGAAKPADGAAKTGDTAAKPAETPAAPAKPDAPSASAGGCGGRCACH